MSSSSSSSLHGFDLVESFILPGSAAIPIRTYVSPLSGLRIVYGNVPGPIVNCSMVLATESFTDFGEPHTLEHLVFMGSKKYPYKGVLDTIANLVGAQGTNASTSEDHTLYSIEIAGESGFFSLLPVYLDHIINPTLTDSAFDTEVHHLNGEGRNAGVVYCEMQAIENESDTLLTRSLLSSIWPGQNPYKYEVGGLLADLRELTNEQVKEYHKKFYRLENLIIIVTGVINESNMLEIIRNFENDNLPKLKVESTFIRPFQNEYPAFTESIEKEIVYGDSDEEVGSVVIGWRACEWEDFLTRTAISVLWTYLSSTALSPLHKSMVEIPDPFCSDFDISLYWNRSSIHAIELEEVPLNKIELCKSKFFECLNELINKKLFDLQRLHTLIIKERRQTLSIIESDGSRYISSSAVSNFLNGPMQYLLLNKNNENNNNKKKGNFHNNSQYEAKSINLQSELDEISRLDELLLKDSQYWLELITEYCIKPPFVCIKARPSKKEAKRINKEEEDRINKQIAKLTNNGENPLELIKLQKKIEESMKNNSIPVPMELLNQYKFPDFTKLNLIPLYSWNNQQQLNKNSINPASSYQYCSHPQVNELNQIFYNNNSTTNINTYTHTNTATAASAIIPLDSNKFPNSFQFTHIPSNFVKFSIGLNCGINNLLLLDSLRYYLPLYRELMFECGLNSIQNHNFNNNNNSNDNNTSNSIHLSPDEFIFQLERDSVLFYNYQGLQSDRFSAGSFSQFLLVQMKFPIESYELGIEWISNILNHIEFSIEKIIISIKKLLSSIPSLKNDGDILSRYIQDYSQFHYPAINKYINIVEQEYFLRELLLEYSINPIQISEKILYNLNYLKYSLIQSNEMRFHIAGDLIKINYMNMNKYNGLFNVWNKKFYIPNINNNQNNNNQNNQNNGIHSSISPLIKRDIKYNIDQYKSLLSNNNNHQQSIHYLYEYLKPTLLTSSADDKLNIIHGLESCESSFIYFTTPIVNNLSTVPAFNSNEILLIRLCIEYLVMLEGVYWRRLRGAGLAYSYVARVRPEANLIVFSIYRCSSPFAAMKESEKILNEFQNNELKFNENDLNAAKCGLIYEIVSSADTIVSAAECTLGDSLRGIENSPEFVAKQIEWIQMATINDLHRILMKYLIHLFDPQYSQLVIVTGLSSANQLKEDIQREWPQRKVQVEENLAAIYLGAEEAKIRKERIEQLKMIVKEKGNPEESEGEEDDEEEDGEDDEEGEDDDEMDDGDDDDGESGSESDSKSR